jgi:hypothetical protein
MADDEISLKGPEELESLIKQKRKEQASYQDRIEAGNKILKDMVNGFLIFNSRITG